MTLDETGFDAQKFTTRVTSGNLPDIVLMDRQAIPQSIQMPAIITNERVMKASGVTDTDLGTSQPDNLIAAIAKMYKSADGNPTVLGFDPVSTGQAPLWILGYGGQVIDSTGKPTLDDPRNETGLNVLK